MADLSAYMRVPVVPGGRSMHGADCWGLVVLIYRDMLGIELPIHDGVDWTKDVEVWDSIARESKKEWHEVAAADRAAYDVVVLRIKNVPWHVGVLVDRERFIHADALRGVHIERLQGLHWKNRVVSYHRLRKE